MPALYPLSDEVEVDMLRKLALFWDGQWFLKTVDEFGLEAAIRLNARVRTAFGRIEMRILLRALGKRRADDLADAIRLLATYSEVLMGGALRADFQTITPIRAEVLIYRCAAYAGARMARLERVDQACVACETLWDAWFEVLLPDTPVTVRHPMRQGKGDLHCHFIITLPSQP
ncbi:MAG TPA: hypothetical protein EYP49_02315 [Anaerolineae bacterium]|nr:hypothetical protein [Anaerolineae bacterium]